MFLNDLLNIVCKKIADAPIDDATNIVGGGSADSGVRIEPLNYRHDQMSRSWRYQPASKLNAKQSLAHKDAPDSEGVPGGGHSTNKTKGQGFVFLTALNMQHTMMNYLTEQRFFGHRNDMDPQHYKTEHEDVAGTLWRQPIIKESKRLPTSWSPEGKMCC